EDDPAPQGRRHFRAGGGAERAERVAGGRPGLCDEPGRHRARGPGRAAARRRGAAQAPAGGVMAKPMLHVDQVAKQYTRGFIDKRVTFSLTADFSIDGPSVVGVMGPNGSG